MSPQTLEEWQEQQRDEEEQRRRWEDQQNQYEQEPNVVPCFRCNAAMYQESDDPMENICESCLNPAPSPTTNTL